MRLHNRCIFIATLVFLGGILLLAPRVCAAGTTIRLNENSSTKGPRILLGEIANISGDQAEAAASIDLGPAATPALSRRLMSNTILSRAKIAGINPATLSIEGPHIIVVSTRFKQVTRDMVVDSVKQYLESGMPPREEEVQMEVDPHMQDLAVPEGKLAFSWRSDPGYSFSGPTVIRGNILVDDKPRRSVTCKLNIKTCGRLQADLKKSHSEKPLKSNQVCLIKRNQAVNVETHSGGLTVTSVAKAETDAAVGEIVRCTNAVSKEAFEGVVRNDGVVVVQ